MKPTEHDELLQTLKARFDKHAQQHKGIAWSKVEARLQEDARALNALAAMEASGGEPDVIGYDKATGEALGTWPLPGLASMPPRRSASSCSPRRSTANSSCWANSIPRRRAGSPRRTMCAPSAAHFSATAATAGCSCTTTGRSPITLRGPSAACCGCEHAQPAIGATIRN